MTPSLAAKTWGAGRPATDLISILEKRAAGPRQVGLAHKDAMGARRIVRDGARVEQVQS